VHFDGFRFTVFDHQSSTAFHDDSIYSLCDEDGAMGR
jgi:hypothetical protein